MTVLLESFDLRFVTAVRCVRVEVPVDSNCSLVPRLLFYVLILFGEICHHQTKTKMRSRVRPALHI